MVRIVVTSNARLKRELTTALINSQTNDMSSIYKEIKDELQLKEAYIRKFYLGTGESEIQLIETNQLVPAKWTYPYNTYGSSITLFPEGREVKDKEGFKYIEVTNNVKVMCLKLNTDYIILGYSNNGFYTGNAGDLKITYGNNSITINKSVLNIVSDNLRINGLPYEEPNFIDDIDKLLDYLNENLIDI